MYTAHLKNACVSKGRPRQLLLLQHSSICAAKRKTRQPDKQADCGKAQGSNATGKYNDGASAVH
jgi:hypothetical protein